MEFQTRKKRARNIINQPIELGGLAMTNIEIRNQANMIVNVRNIEGKIRQPWACYIFIGLEYNYVKYIQTLLKTNGYIQFKYQNI